MAIIEPSGVQQAGTLLAQSAVAVPHTGDTNEAVLATIAVPANAIGRNGIVRIAVTWSYTNSANTKTCRIRFGASGSGTGGTPVTQAAVTTTVLFRTLVDVANVAATNVQKVTPTLVTSVNIFGSASGGVTPAAIDTTAATEINITGQLASAAETITLEAYQVLLYFHA